MSEEKINVLDEYKKIAAKLQKKMFRKIPYSQVADQFAKLSLDLQRTGQTHYSAFCMISAGQSDKLEMQQRQPPTFSNAQPQASPFGIVPPVIPKPFVGGAYFCITAGRVFASSAIHEKNTIHYFSAEEFVSEAILAFQQSIEIYENHQEFGLCETLCFELAFTLKLLERYHESSQYYIKCYQYSKKTNHVATQVQSLKEAYYCQVEIGDFELATESLQLILFLATQYSEQLSNSKLPDYKLVDFSASSGLSTTPSTATSQTPPVTPGTSAPTTPVPALSLSSPSKATATPTSATPTTGKPPQSSPRQQVQSSGFVDQRKLDFTAIMQSITETIIETSVNLVLVFLIQKRNKEAHQILTQIPTGGSRKTLLLIYLHDNLVPLLHDLLDCCVDNDINSMRYLIENELKFGAGLSEIQKRLLYIVQYVHENPIFLDYQNVGLKDENEAKM